MQSLSKSGSQIVKSFHTLVNSVSRAPDPIRLQLPPRTVKDEYQRFRLWSTNLGLQQVGHASLDYRLQDAETAREYTGELLEELDEYLSECKSRSIEFPDRQHAPIALATCPQGPDRTYPDLLMILSISHRHW
jgi:hypothetical protein